MDSQSIVQEVGTVAMGERATVNHQGHAYEAMGAFLSASHAIGYLSSDHKTWQGAFMGTVISLKSWRTPRSYVSTRMYQVDAVINGLVYTGRCAGEGMIWRGKRKAS